MSRRVCHGTPDCPCDECAPPCARAMGCLCAAHAAGAAASAPCCATERPEAPATRADAIRLAVEGIDPDYPVTEWDAVDLERYEEETEEGRPGRFLLYEIGSGTYALRRWLSTWDDPTAAVRYHLTQEHAEDWQLRAVVDLDTLRPLLVRRSLAVLPWGGTLAEWGQGYDLPWIDEEEPAEGVTLADALAELRRARTVLRWAAQEGEGRVRRELVGGWAHHADEIGRFLAGTAKGPDPRAVLRRVAEIIEATYPNRGTDSAADRVEELCALEAEVRAAAGLPPLLVCQNCEGAWHADEVRPVRDLAERVGPGEPVPADECPECGAVVHPIRGEP